MDESALNVVEDFDAQTLWARNAEAALSRKLFDGVREESHVYERLEIARSVFRNCVFDSCAFARSSFTEVKFVGCDFSNCDFSEAYFKDCYIEQSKALGAKFTHAIWRGVKVVDSRFTGAYFDEARMDGVDIISTDCAEASFSSMKVKRFTAHDSRFVANDFFKTPLAGIDFSECVFEAPLVSKPPAELAGVVVNMFQAAQLAGLMGVVVTN